MKDPILKSMKGTWTQMLYRCKSPKSFHWNEYGGRGILVTERWLIFDNFLNDMGIKPSLLYQIDRINCDGNYEPGNCRWVTAKENMRNRRCTRILCVGGITKPISEWAEITGLCDETIRNRIAAGKTPEECIGPHVKSGRPRSPTSKRKYASPNQTTYHQGNVP